MKKPEITDIPIGRENAISRKKLAELWGLSDRRMRIEIANFRQEDNGDDFIIVSYSSGGGGYYRTDELEEIVHFRNELSKRARNTFLPLKKVRRILKERGDG